MKKRTSQACAALGALAVVLLLIVSGCSQETDVELIAKMDVAVQAGSFTGQPGALRAVSALLGRGNAKAKEPRVVDCLISTCSGMLTDNAEWTDSTEARKVYDTIKLYDDGTVIEGLVRRVVADAQGRLHVLYLGIKLGITGSEERLNEVLYAQGDKAMAEDFLNSGSEKLYGGGKKWANDHGYNILTGMGSNRASWGSF